MLMPQTISPIAVRIAAGYASHSRISAVFWLLLALACLMTIQSLSVPEKKTSEMRVPTMRPMNSSLYTLSLAPSVQVTR
jgi:hypothetical protein